jgi:hypothetical protein
MATRHKTYFRSDGQTWYGFTTAAWGTAAARASLRSFPLLELVCAYAR